MRFAFVATSVAAIVAVPLALAAAGPQMSSTEFLSAVRCTAYADATQNADLAGEKYRLNSEALHQPAETVAMARGEAREIAREAAAGDASLGEVASSCTDQQLVNGAESEKAV